MNNEDTLMTMASHEEPQETTPQPEVKTPDTTTETAQTTPPETPPDKSRSTPPDNYQFKTPDGVAHLDPQTLDIFTPVAKALALTQEQAQTLVDIYPKIQARQAEAWAIQSAEWEQQVRDDREIGGDNLDANIGRAQKALDQFGTPELRQYLDASGLGNHPALVRFCINVGNALSEDDAVISNPISERTAAEILYGH